MVLTYGGLVVLHCSAVKLADPAYCFGLQCSGFKNVLFKRWPVFQEIINSIITDKLFEIHVTSDYEKNATDNYYSKISSENSFCLGTFFSTNSFINKQFHSTFL